MKSDLSIDIIGKAKDTALGLAICIIDVPNRDRGMCSGAKEELSGFKGADAPWAKDDAPDVLWFLCVSYDTARAFDLRNNHLLPCLKGSPISLFIG
jgi:hypothetical protein